MEQEDELSDEEEQVLWAKPFGAFPFRYAAKRGTPGTVMTVIAAEEKGGQPIKLFANRAKPPLAGTRTRGALPGQLFESYEEPFCVDSPPITVGASPMTTSTSVETQESQTCNTANSAKRQPLALWSRHPDNDFGILSVKRFEKGELRQYNIRIPMPNTFEQGDLFSRLLRLPMADQNHSWVTIGLIALVVLFLVSGY